MNKFIEFQKNQRNNALTHLKSGYIKYANEIYLHLIESLELMIFNNNERSSIQRAKVVCEIEKEIKEQSGHGLQSAYEYFFSRSNIINYYLIEIKKNGTKITKRKANDEVK